MKTLCGHIVSGVGNFGYWIDKLSAHYKGKTGMVFFPGTLNVKLEEPFSIPAKCLRLEADEYGGNVSVNLVPCTVLGRSAFILRTDKNEAGLGVHPKTIIEIATDVKLRDVYNLEDGDEIEVELEL
jgi:riboflavin kinase